MRIWEFGGKPEGQRSLGRTRWIILKWLLEKRDRRPDIAFISLRISLQVGGQF
jgi:hypothetical protein